jgi:asparagine synthase (glutamine-hydrolysing)
VLEFKNLDKIGALRGFDRGAYRAALAAKLGKETLSRVDVALLYAALRSSAFAGPTCKEMNLLGYSLLPFAEPRLAFPASRVPLEHKAYGRFEAEMIRRLSPRLAAYPSSYGHPFGADMPLAKRMRESAERHCRGELPLPLVALAYRLLRKKSQYNSAPHYYSEKYLRTVLDLSRLAIADYVDPQAMRAVDDPHFLSRVLSVELLLTTSWRDASALPRAA